MFTVHHIADGRPRTDTYTERDAIRLLRTGRGRGVEIDPRNSGGAILRWTPAASNPFRRIPREIRIDALIPVRMTAAIRADLERVRHPDPTDLTDTAKSHLRTAGLITTGPGGAARLTLTAQLALTACTHRTHTRDPRGYHSPADSLYAIAAVGLNKPGGRAYRLHDITARASCDCGALDYSAADRGVAARAARQHRSEAAAALIASL